MERRLATIMAVDAVGFSARMERDEEATLAALQADREVIDSLISGADGRVFGSAGDSVIAEFASPVAAARCALEIQENFRIDGTGNSFQFRIGLHVGDVMVQDENLMGDGVNVAARLEQLAPMGGIAMSERIAELVQGNIDSDFAFSGQHRLKNIRNPVSVWIWPQGSVKETRPKGRYGSALLALCVALVLVIAVATYSVWPKVATKNTSGLQSIAVMAFTDESPGPDRGYLSSSISEGIIDELSKFPEIRTIARNSSFSFRGKDPTIEEVREALGVNFILDGSQQKIGEDLVVSARLIDTRTSKSIWSQRYDGSVGELYEFQGEIIRAVASTIGGVLAHYVPPNGTRATVTAQHLHAQGLSLMNQLDPGKQIRAGEFFQEAIEVDPTAFHGYIGMGFHLRNQAGRATDPTERDALLNQSEAMASKALEISPDHYLVHYLMGHLETERGNLDRAIARYDKAKVLNPSFSNVYAGIASPKVYLGDIEGAVKDVKYAIDIDPLHPEWFHWQLSWALWAAKDCDQAVIAIQRITEMPVPALLTLATAQVCDGRIEDAQATMRDYQDRGGKGTISSERQRFEERWTAPGGLDRWLEDLRVAGMPE